MDLVLIKTALAFFYCAYYLCIFSLMFCGEITTNRRQLCRFHVFNKIADLKTSQARRFRGKFAKHGNKKNNSFRNIISHKSANAAEMSGPEMSVTDILRNVYNDRCASTTATSKTFDDIDSSDINPGLNKVVDKDSYYTCSRQLRMTCAGDDS